MSFWDEVKKGANLLDQTFVQPAIRLGTATVQEFNAVHDLVHAVEQPIQNIVKDSTVVVGGMYHLTQGAMHLLPYVVGGWLAWTAFSNYFPAEKRALESSLTAASKRMRLT